MFSLIKLDFFFSTEALKVFDFGHFYTRLIEDEHAEFLGFVPDQRNSFLLNRLRLPLIVIELRSGAIELFQIVEFYDFIGGVVDVICLILDVHGVRVIDFLHQLNQLKCAKVHKLCQGGLDVFIARAEESLLLCTAILKDRVEDVRFIGDRSGTVQQTE